jgi:hypothetical protein
MSELSESTRRRVREHAGHRCEYSLSHQDYVLGRLQMDHIQPIATGLTACGRATVSALSLNNQLAVIVRRNWINAGWHPP